MQFFLVGAMVKKPSKEIVAIRYITAFNDENEYQNERPHLEKWIIENHGHLVAPVAVYQLSPDDLAALGPDFYFLIVFEPVRKGHNALSDAIIKIIVMRNQGSPATIEALALAEIAALCREKHLSKPTFGYVSVATVDSSAIELATQTYRRRQSKAKTSLSGSIGGFRLRL
jgi:hypothetical protein